MEHEHSHDHAYLHEHNIPHLHHETDTHDEAHNHTHSHDAANGHGHVHENTQAVLNRLSRAIGHLEKVKRMVEEGYDCSEVLIQLAAVESAIRSTSRQILRNHMETCVTAAIQQNDEETLSELYRAIDELLK